eukprot:TRINITY_DN9219_c0_g1_i1.p1 TRINITY_DN9219_c0_g1~~TRINITY_DN9219_c0_g1_i1.p1  ORF type:complete len:147 (+),score=26.18 TRINITY_DN9219_c0_g1_i1:90-530(+)
MGCGSSSSAAQHSDPPQTPPPAVAEEPSSQQPSITVSRAASQPVVETASAAPVVPQLQPAAPKPSVEVSTSGLEILVSLQKCDGMTALQLLRELQSGVASAATGTAVIQAGPVASIKLLNELASENTTKQWEGISLLHQIHTESQK